VDQQRESLNGSVVRPAPQTIIRRLSDPEIDAACRLLRSLDSASLDRLWVHLAPETRQVTYFTWAARSLVAAEMSRRARLAA
jgi:hypothetical protein